MHVPPLVTSGPSTTEPGHLGDPTTTILFGNDSVNNDIRSGGRLRVGKWLDDCQTVAIEGEYAAVERSTTDYGIWSDGNPIVSRPFLDTSTTPPQERVQLVAFPGAVDGSINVNASTRFQSAGARLLFTAWQDQNCWCDPCNGMMYHDTFRSQVIVGYRFLRLDDGLGVTEQLTVTGTATNPAAVPGTAFLVHDQFNTKNEFNGAEIGMHYEYHRNCWSLDFVPKIAVGSTHETVGINGFTQSTDPTGARTLFAGGLLSQGPVSAANYPGNIGVYSRDVFAVVPELDANLGYQLTSHLKATLGYTFIYWSRVARSGDQVDLAVNSTFVPPPSTPTGDTTHPKFAFQDTSFWAQGLNFGLEFRW